MTPLSSTDPSAIANAARCWAMCVGGSSAASIKTYLLTKTADIATPPCVTPTAPSQPVVFSSLDTILKIRWTQPANTGSLITSYTVSYGTTQGGPYTNSVTLAGGATRQAILNGLSSGTTYYFTVTANSFTGCSSAASAEGSGATTGTPAIDPAVTAWQARVIANGGASPSQATLNAADTFWKGIKTDGLDSLIIALNFFAPDNLIAAITPFIKGPGNDPWTNIGPFVAGDITTSGLLTDGGTKCLDTGVVPTTAFTSNNDFGISGYTGNITGLWSFQSGSFDNVNIAEIDIQGVGSGILAGAWAAWNINVAGLISGSTFGFVSVSRITTMAAYQANSIIGFNTVTSGVAGSQTRPTPTIAMAGRNTNGVFSPTVRGAWYSFGAIHHGLTAAQTQALYNRVQTLRQTLGGGFA